MTDVRVTHPAALGMVGLGIMGSAIASSLASAGWNVAGFDINPGRLTALIGAGIEPSGSLEELIQATDIILTSLPSAQAVRATAIKMAAAPRKKILVETSTLSLEDKLAVQQMLYTAGHITLDCPLSGTGAQARSKDLIVYASGDSPTISGLHPLFLSFARKVFDVGQYGNGTRLKLIANLLVAIHNVATAEAMTLADRAGLDLSRAVELISAGAGTSRIFEQRGPLMADGNYEPASMKLDLWKKDLAVIMDFAAKCDSPVPLLNATLPIYAAALEEGGHRDTAAVFTVLSHKHHRMCSDRDEKPS
jgi:L-threonate 2-dehydrogenase